MLVTLPFASVQICAAAEPTAPLEPAYAITAQNRGSAGARKSPTCGRSIVLATPFARR